MNLRTYQALSLNEALSRIRSDLGENAVILHSRTFRRGGLMGLGGQLVYEVTASPPAPRTPRIAETASATAANCMNEPRTAAAAQPKSDSTSPRAAAIALALAEQQRRRRKQKDGEAPRAAADTVTPSTTLPRRDAAPSPQPSAPLEAPATPAAAHTMSSAPLRAARGGSRMREDRHADVAPVLPVARRFVLSPEPRLPVSAGRPSASAPSNGTEGAEKATPAAFARRDVTKQPDPGLHREIAALKQMVGQVLQRQSGTLQGAMPEALFNEYLSLIQSEVAQEIADELCAAVRAELPESELSDPSRVRASFRRHLARHVPVAPNLMPAATADGRPFTLALVGPTGVGKTTTVAKLAASFKLRHHRRVGLITTDTYRIAAVDQLRTYANIIGTPLKVALTPQEMREACQSLDHCEVILIDTAGRSPNDAARLEEIQAFTDAADPHEVHLVLSSTCSEPALMRTIERFSAVRADRVIFTKTDEAVSLGVLINVMRKAGKELSFITTGQEVPDHIEPGNPDRLASLVLGEKGQG